MKWPLLLLLSLTLVSHVFANTNDLGQMNGDDCDGACSQNQASGGEGAGVLVAALGPIANVSDDLLEEHKGTICSLARDNSWQDLSNFVDSIQGLSMSDVLAKTSCIMAETTANPYTGNIFHTTARYSGLVADIIKYATRYLLKDNDHKNVFVGLIRGVGGRENIFTELKIAWENIPNKRADLQIAARAICLSIDRFNVTELSSIRNQECKQEPFVF